MQWMVFRIGVGDQVQSTHYVTTEYNDPSEAARKVMGITNRTGRYAAIPIERIVNLDAPAAQQAMQF